MLSLGEKSGFLCVLLFYLCIAGDLMLAKPLKQLIAITRSHQPILLTILAEEERINTKEPTPMSATATIALLLAEAGNTPPYFDNDQ